MNRKCIITESDAVSEASKTEAEDRVGYGLDIMINGSVFTYSWEPGIFCPWNSGTKFFDWIFEFRFRLLYWPCPCESSVDRVMKHPRQDQSTGPHSKIMGCTFRWHFLLQTEVATLQEWFRKLQSKNLSGRYQDNNKDMRKYQNLAWILPLCTFIFRKIIF